MRPRATAPTREMCPRFRLTELLTSDSLTLPPHPYGGPNMANLMTLAIATGWDAAPAIILLSLSIPYLILGLRKEGKR